MDELKEVVMGQVESIRKLESLVLKLTAQLRDERKKVATLEEKLNRLGEMGTREVWEICLLIGNRFFLGEVL